MAKASVHVKRHLQPRELRTIAAALDLLINASTSEQLELIRAHWCPDDGLLSDDDMRALMSELLNARKVKVCRTKHKES